MQSLVRKLWGGLLCICLYACLWGSAAGVQAQTVNSENPDDGAIWKKVRSSLFQTRPILTEGNDVISLEAPARAEDAAIVPIALRARFLQTAERSIDRVYLVIDNNPSPVSATFYFSLLSGRADVETRVRIEQYTFVRAIAETHDGQLYMATRFVKASGGCSAPPAKDAQAAQASLGRMRLRVEEMAHASQPVLAQLMISHPNSSGLVMDQVSRLYAPAHFVRSLQVTLEGEPVLSADLDISISENPNFRFYVLPRRSGTLRAEVQDSQDLRFHAEFPLQVLPSPTGPAASVEQRLLAQRVAPGVYLLPGAPGIASVQNQGRIGNVGFIVGEAGVLVINTGTSYRHGLALLEAIHRTTDKPVLLAVVTHTRPEFLLGAAAFQAQGIPVHMHHEAAELMRSRCKRCLKKLQDLLGMDAMQGTLIAKPEQEFDRSHAVAGLGRNIQVLYFGHSSGPGDVAVLDEQTGVLFAGGLVDNLRIPDVQDGELSGWASALQSLRSLPLTSVVPAHGAVGALELVRDTERYLAQLENRVATLQQQGTTLQAIGEAASLPEFAAWDGYDTDHKRNAATVYVRLERATLYKP